MDRQTELTNRPARNVLMVVAKQPTPGNTKTRLCPPLSLLEAADLYECFLLDTLDVIRQVPDVQPVIAYLPQQALSYFQRIAPDFGTIFQFGCRLGERLNYCLSTYLDLGHKNVVIMSSDTPTLPPACLTEAFQALDAGADVVLGPCDDGGYYLIGLRRAFPALLLDVKMSTTHVTRDTLAIAKKAGLSCSLLNTWYDIDDASALCRLVEELKRSGPDVGRNTRSLLDSTPAYLKWITVG